MIKHSMLTAQAVLLFLSGCATISGGIDKPAHTITPEDAGVISESAVFYLREEFPPASTQIVFYPPKTIPAYITTPETTDTATQTSDAKAETDIAHILSDNTVPSPELKPVIVDYMRASFRDALASAGYALPEQNSFADDAISLRYDISASKDGVLLRMQADKSDISGWFDRHYDGRITATDIFTVRKTP